ncbi:IPT/TIG domain-containing protein, partial [Vibrio parahaemolyticus]
PGATVTVGGVAATSVTVVNINTLTAVTPTGTAGLTDVVVSYNGQSSTTSSSDQFNYVPASLDVEGNGNPTALTDGLLILRYL